jgi:hypothetical protein
MTREQAAASETVAPKQIFIVTTAADKNLGERA